MKVEVGTTAVPILFTGATSTDETPFAIRPVDGDIFVGWADDVTADDGYPVKQNEVFTGQEGLSGKTLYGIAASGTVDVRVILR